MLNRHRGVGAAAMFIVALIMVQSGCAEAGAGPAEPETGTIQGTVLLEGYGPLPGAIVRVRRVGGSSVFVPTDAQGNFSHVGKSDVWDVSVTGSDGFSASDTATAFVPPDQTIVFEPLVVQRLVYDVELREGLPGPYQTEIGAYAVVRWTNLDTVPHQIRFIPAIGTSVGIPTSPILNTGEQFEWPFDSQESATSTAYNCALHHAEFSGQVLVDWEWGAN